MLGKILGFDCMHENKIFFISFFFSKREINLKVLRFCFEIFRFFRNILTKTEYFNTGFVFYNVKIQPNIKQN